jgi:hypothetical protein
MVDPQTVQVWIGAHVNLSGWSVYGKTLYPVSVIVEDLLTWTAEYDPIPIIIDRPLYVAPPVGEEDVSPELGDTKARTEVIEMWGNNVQNLWHLQWVLSWPGLHGYLWQWKGKRWSGSGLKIEKLGQEKGGFITGKTSSFDLCHWSTFRSPLRHRIDEQTIY